MTDIIREINMKLNENKYFRSRDAQAYDFVDMIQNNPGWKDECILPEKFFAHSRILAAPQSQARYRLTKVAHNPYFAQRLTFLGISSPVAYIQTQTNKKRHENEADPHMQRMRDIFDREHEVRVCFHREEEARTFYDLSETLYVNYFCADKKNSIVLDKNLVIASDFKALCVLLLSFQKAPAFALQKSLYCRLSAERQCEIEQFKLPINEIKAILNLQASPRTFHVFDDGTLRVSFLPKDKASQDTFIQFLDINKIEYQIKLNKPHVVEIDQVMAIKLEKRIIDCKEGKQSLKDSPLTMKTSSKFRPMLFNYRVQPKATNSDHSSRPLTNDAIYKVLSNRFGVNRENIKRLYFFERFGMLRIYFGKECASQAKDLHQQLIKDGMDSKYFGKQPDLNGVYSYCVILNQDAVLRLFPEVLATQSIKNKI